MSLMIGGPRKNMCVHCQSNNVEIACEYLEWYLMWCNTCKKTFGRKKNENKVVLDNSALLLEPWEFKKVY